MRKFAVFVSLIVSGVLFANDVITLKNGTVIEGEVYKILENGDLCVHKTDGNDILIQLSDIVSRASKNNEEAPKVQPKVQKYEWRKDPDWFGDSLTSLSSTGIMLNVSFIHGFNSSALNFSGNLDYDWYVYDAVSMKDGNGAMIGVSYSIGLNKSFSLEPGVSAALLHYKLYSSRYYWDAESLSYIVTDKYDWSANYLGLEIPVLVTYQVGVGKSCDLVFKLGPSFQVYRELRGSNPSNSSVGIQIDTGVKFSKSYVGLGVNLCCWSHTNQTSFWLSEKRHRLNISYSYIF